MIVDCHTHIWQSPDQLGQVDLGDLPRGQRSMFRPPGQTNWRATPAADPDHHMAQSTAVDKSIVLGFRSRYLRADIPNRFIADYVSRFPQKLIGFAGIDPTERGAAKEVRSAQSDLQLQGITLSPTSQDFHPTDTRAMDVYAVAEELAMPVLIHSASQYTRESKLEYARPMLFDEVARTFPKLRLIISQIGQPWFDETIALIAKHPTVFADVSGLLSRPWQAYNALVLAYQSGVMEKLLFGSDFPYTNAAQCIEAMYSINQIPHGTNLPVIPRESLRGIVERDALTLLGLE